MKAHPTRVTYLFLLLVVAGATGALAEPAVDIWPMVGAPVGSQQAYVATQTVSIKVVDRQGIFLLQDPGSLERNSTITELITYTVLEPDAQGSPRLLVESQPLDPATRRPLVAPKWQGVYRLDQTAVLEEGVEPTRPLTSPEWLVWGYEQDESSNAPMEPGESRRLSFATTDLPLPMITENALNLVAENGVLEFTGWDAIEGEEASVATITFNTELGGESEAHGVLRMVAEGDWSGYVRMVPEWFPWESRQVFQGTITSEVVPDHGLAGHLELEINTTVTHVQVAPASLTTVHPIETGDALSRVLQAEEGWALADGAQADLYAFTGSEGEVVRIVAESTDFDAYLMLMDHGWEIILEDDDSAGSNNALLRYRLPYTGAYTIIVTTASPNQSGRYSLTLESLGREVDPVVMEAILDHGIQGIWQALEEQDWVSVIGILERTLERARLQLPLQLDQVTLVTERSAGYGEYVPRASRLYRSGESVQVYLEPKNFHTRSEAGRYEIHLTVDAVLVAADGTVVSELPDVVVWNRITGRPVSDVSLSIPLWVGHVPGGSYTWRITVRDIVSAQSATVEVPIVVSGTQTAPL